MKSSKIIFSVLSLISFIILITGVYLFLAPGTLQRMSSSPAQSQQVKQEQSSGTAAKQDLADLPAVSPDDWELVLVNHSHPTEELNPEVTYVEGIPVDSRIAQATIDFMAEMRRLDPDPLEGLYSGYRSVAEQAALVETRVAEAMASGLSEEEARAEVAKTVMPAGSSEHHTGLAIDLMKNSDVSEAIAAAAPNYGFILRYPAGKEDITGISNENWHYRYVGVESAKYMAAHDLVLEEYLDLLRGQE